MGERATEGRRSDTGTMAITPSALGAALAKVGATPESLRDLLGSFLESGHAYVVGSLGAGYGNSRSDIDLHIFDASMGESGGNPMMFFLDRTIVDVVYYEPGEPQRLTATLTRHRLPVAGGSCTLGAPVSKRLQSRLGRWLTAIPFTTDAPPLLTNEEIPAAIAAATRGALTDFVLAMAYGDLVACSESSRSAPAMWRRAARALLEVVVRARGEIFVGDRWVWHKAEKLRLPSALLAELDDTRTREELARVADRLNVPIPEPYEFVTLRPGHVEDIAIGERQFVLVDRQRLVDRSIAVSGPLHSAVRTSGAKACIAAVANGVARAEVNEDDVDAWLRRK
jgi:hypothetical protein